jgi:hypothetical protein
MQTESYQHIVTMNASRWIQSKKHSKKRSVDHFRTLDGVQKPPAKTAKV